MSFLVFPEDLSAASFFVLKRHGVSAGSPRSCFAAFFPAFLLEQNNERERRGEHSDPKLSACARLRETLF